MTWTSTWTTSRPPTRRTRWSFWGTGMNLSGKVRAEGFRGHHGRPVPHPVPSQAHPLAGSSGSGRLHRALTGGHPWAGLLQARGLSWGPWLSAVAGARAPSLPLTRTRGGQVLTQVLEVQGGLWTLTGRKQRLGNGRGDQGAPGTSHTHGDLRKPSWARGLSPPRPPHRGTLGLVWGHLRLSLLEEGSSWPVARQPAVPLSASAQDTTQRRTPRVHSAPGRPGPGPQGGVPFTGVSTGWTLERRPSAGAVRLAWGGADRG